MSCDWRSRQRAALTLFLMVLTGLSTCAKVNTAKAPVAPSTSGDGGVSDTATGGPDVAGGLDTIRPIVTDAAVLEIGGCASGVTCSPANGQYCGVIGNGCSGTLDCGACPAGQICENRLCVGGTDCLALSCQVATGKYCGSVGNGCGRAMDCGGCAANQICSGSGLCVAGTGCVPLTCNAAASRFCGIVGDGCGGMLDCGACAAPATCGGRGARGVCGDPNCVKITCTPGGGGQYCGTIGDGCGGTLDCGTTCPGGMTCGAAPAGGGTGIPNVCPGTGPSGPCVGLACMIPSCTGAARTTLSGTIRDPAGRVPLYNVNVYVPNAALDPIPEGVSCDRCSAQLSGKPIATALTDANGRFVLENVPAIQNLPVVIQVGKWRREIRIPSVTACVDNPITDANLTRLPRTKAEGNIPKMALTTGGSDALECLLRKIGIADAEFTTDTGAGRVHLYNGGSSSSSSSLGTDRFATTLNGGAVFPQATTLWGSASRMLGYDIVLMSCESNPLSAIKRPFYANMKQYGDSGGRIFASHLHFTWLWDENATAAWPNTATYTGGSDEEQDPPSFGEAGYVPGTIDTTFPKGAALADWLVAVGATPTRGQIDLWDLAHSVSQVTPPTQRWIYLPTNSRWPSQGTSTQYMTFNTPVGAAAAAQCGRVVHTDLHVKAAAAAPGERKDTSEPGTAGTPFPTGCTSVSLSAQEKALEFLFFDLSACVQPDTDRPVPPPVPPPGVPATPPGVTPVPPPIPPPPPPPPPPPIP